MFARRAKVVNGSSHSPPGGRQRHHTLDLGAGGIERVHQVAVEAQQAADIAADTAQPLVRQPSAPLPLLAVQSPLLLGPFLRLAGQAPESARSTRLSCEAPRGAGSSRTVRGSGGGRGPCSVAGSASDGGKAPGVSSPGAAPRRVTSRVTSGALGRGLAWTAVGRPCRPRGHPDTDPAAGGRVAVSAAPNSS